MTEGKSGYKLTTKSREPGVALDVYESETKRSEFFDGFGSVSVGPAVSRVQLFSIAEIFPDQTLGMIEVRHVDHELIVPTSSLVECAANILLTFAQNKEALTSANAFVINRIDEIVKNIKKQG